jgi:hypothetical protein
MPAAAVLEGLATVLLEGLEFVAPHLLQAPGYLVLRFVLWRPRERVTYDSDATAWAGGVVWILGVVFGLALLVSR